MAHPTLKEIIYRCSVITKSQYYQWDILESKLNLIKVVFFIMMSSPDCDQDEHTRAKSIFTSLYDKCFDSCNKVIIESNNCKSILYAFCLH